MKTDSSDPTMTQTNYGSVDRNRLILLKLCNMVVNPCQLHGQNIVSPLHCFFIMHGFPQYVLHQTHRYRGLKIFTVPELEVCLWC